MLRFAFADGGLKQKVVIVLTAVLGAVFLCNFAIYHRVIARHFTELEYENALSESRRMAAALAVEEQRVAGYAHDWGAWTDTYRFVGDLNEDYRQSNLLLPSFRNNRMQLLHMYAPDGRLIWGKAYDLSSGEEFALAAFPRSGLAPNHPLLVHPAVNSEVVGVLATERGPIMVASCPITNSEQTAPPRGVLVMGRLLDASVVRRLRVQLRYDLHLTPATGVAELAAGRLVRQANNGLAIELREESPATLRTVIRIADIFGRPAIALTAQMLRPIAARGRDAEQYTELSLAALGVLMLCAAMLAVHGVVTRPVENLTKNVLRAKDRSRATPIEVALARGDELGVLSREFQAALQRAAEHADEMRAANERLALEIEERRRATLALRSRERFEQLIAQLAARFINLRADEIDDGIRQCLQTVSEHFEVDHGYVAVFSDDGARMRITHEWTRPGLEGPTAPAAAEAPTELFAWCMTRLRQGDIVNIPCVAELPAEARAERELLELQEIQSRVAAPILQGDRLRGCFGLDAMRAPRQWDAESVTLLRIVAELLANALSRKAVEAELIRAKAEAEAATLAKSDFLARMSHEIRTPMNAVIGMAHLLMETGLAPEQVKYAQTLRSSADGLMRIINDILDLSKIEAGRLMLEETPFDLRKTVEETVALHASRAAEKGVAVALRLAPDAPRRVVGDPVRVRQVLGNLLSNAVKFTRQGGVFINVEATIVDDRAALTFSVGDSGVGIALDKQKTIFERFAQADASTARRFGGTGLGLAICRQLTELMGGEIDVESEPGAGAVFQFSVTLPTAPDEPAAAEPSVRALVIGDEAAKTASLLSASGVSAAAASTAAAALAALRTAADGGAPFDAAIVAERLPDGDGVTFAAQLKADAGLGKTAVVLATDGDPRRKGWIWASAGVGDFVRRPLSVDALRPALAAGRRAADGLGPPPLSLAARAAANVATPTSAPDERGEFAGRRVLLVEDNDASQRAAAWMLEKMGCAADVAADGGEAITKAAAGEYDAILMDVQMPVMDGYAATAAIRRGQRGPRRTPIIAMTANAMAGDRERCLAGGMDDYVSKPIVKAELRAVLGKWFGPQSAGARETTAGGPATFNREAALSRFDGDAEVLGQLAGLFLREAAARTPKIAQAIAAGEWPTALRLAHTTKGGASYVGADAAQQAAAELEAAARAADLAAAQRWLAALQARLREFADATTTLTMST